MYFSISWILDPREKHRRILQTGPCKCEPEVVSDYDRLFREWCQVFRRKRFVFYAR